MYLVHNVLSCIRVEAKIVQKDENLTQAYPLVK